VKEYKFKGWENADVAPINNEYKGINDPRDLYDALDEIWCEYSCAPRLREKWSVNDKTVGQCSITAFLAQDIFGGKVYGVPLPEGGFHCYNVVGDCLFDLAVEQFHGEPLEFAKENEQLREVHFADQDKKNRYEYLKRELKKRCEA